MPPARPVRLCLRLPLLAVVQSTARFAQLTSHCLTDHFEGQQQQELERNSHPAPRHRRSAARQDWETRPTRLRRNLILRSGRTSRRPRRAEEEEQSCDERAWISSCYAEVETAGKASPAEGDPLRSSPGASSARRRHRTHISPERLAHSSLPRAPPLLIDSAPAAASDLPARGERLPLRGRVLLDPPRPGRTSAFPHRGRGRREVCLPFRTPAIGVRLNDLAEAPQSTGTRSPCYLTLRPRPIAKPHRPSRRHSPLLLTSASAFLSLRLFRVRPLKHAGPSQL